MFKFLKWIYNAGRHDGVREVQIFLLKDGHLVVNDIIEEEFIKRGIIKPNNQ